LQTGRVPALKAAQDVASSTNVALPVPHGHLLAVGFDVQTAPVPVQPVRVYFSQTVVVADFLATQTLAGFRPKGAQPVDVHVVTDAVFSHPRSSMMEAEQLSWYSTPATSVHVGY
jgi:hypothetical protein